MTGKKTAVQLLATAAVGLLALLGTGTTASAAAVGPSGTSASVTSATTYHNFQVSVRTRYSDKIRICGHNQKSDSVCSPWTASPNAWTEIPHWWWNGEIYIEGYQYTGSNTRYMYCVLPSSSTSTVVYCDGYSYL